MYYMEDEILAKNLYKQFHERRVPQTYYEDRENDQNNTNVISTQLEYTDPTPNIHSLFVQFDKRFFWGHLASVEVKWSHRMTSCAGICSYQGRRGLCTISLSAPLLSLRPRKDLVETLLHEMIHAYLFLTDRDDDRDGHGPKFHSHMNRINKQAGTNISVYHTFHDEVEYHQKHVWRCNGICQKKKPYFGLYRSATNRAPGPNNFWWAKHKFECGGTYEKISEPEKPIKKRGGSKQPADKNKVSPGKSKDIRNFFTPHTSQTNNMPKIVGLWDLTGKDKGCNQETTISSNKTNTQGNLSNVVGFQDLTSTKKKAGSNFSGAVMNKGSGTLVVTKNTNKLPKDQIVKPSNVKSNGKAESVSKKLPSKESQNVKATVRNIWANKVFNENKNNVQEALIDLTEAKIEPDVEIKRKKVSCPVCNCHFSETELNTHLDECLLASGSDVYFENGNKKVNCPACNKEIQESELDGHLGQCLESSFEDDIFEVNSHSESSEKNLLNLESQESVSCPVCNKNILRGELSSHLNTCLNCSFENENDDIEENNENEPKQMPCPCCMAWFTENEMNSHIDDCLTIIALKNNFFDN